MDGNILWFGETVLSENKTDCDIVYHGFHCMSSPSSVDVSIVRLHAGSEQDLGSEKEKHSNRRSFTTIQETNAYHKFTSINYG